MAQHGFYDAGPLSQVAINLFYGWGYNFYRQENQLRADDQLIRAKAGWLMGLALASVQQAESAWRRETMAAPTREKPFPDAEAVKVARTLEQMGAQIDGVIGRLHGLPVPENDRMTQRYRSEIDTLTALGSCDAQLIGQGDLLRSLVEGKTGAWLNDNAAVVQDGLAAIGKTLQKRQALLA